MTISDFTELKLKDRIFWVFGLLTMISVWFWVFTDEKLFLALPFGALLVFQTVINYKSIYFLLFATIPISTEVYLSNGLSTDLPSEPLIIGLMLVYLIQLLSKPESFDGNFWKHPLTILLLLHFLWTIIATVVSSNQTVSIKFSLAKLWYILTFFFLTGHILKNEKNAWNIWWWIIIPLTLATLKVVVHHAWMNFGFKEINRATDPFFRNHVSYAAILALMIPVLWFLWGRYKLFSKNWLILGAAFFILTFGVATAYTRAAYLALFIAVAVYFLIRFKLINLAFISVLLIVPFVFTYLIQDNKYMEYAPSERTVSHVGFNDIVAATYKLEDVSTSERYYRWIAGIRMFTDHPHTGIGPGNFYFSYKGYTLNKFKTYVSKNPEKSGIHNYYLMILVEQGWIGLLIFLVLIIFTFNLGQKVYHECGDNRSRKALTMGLLLLLTVVDAFLIMNDMIETDKVGSFFFFCMAILINLDLQNKKDKLLKNQPTRLEKLNPN